MKLHRVTLDGCRAANGLVVVVDVLRAFTTAAIAFARDVEEILLVSTVEEAFELRARYPDYLLIGEVDGLPVDGFDLPKFPIRPSGSQS
jgi:2-phosphosulfolactate phosphatase